MLNTSLKLRNTHYLIFTFRTKLLSPVEKLAQTSGLQLWLLIRYTCETCKTKVPIPRPYLIQWNVTAYGDQAAQSITQVIPMCRQGWDWTRCKNSSKSETLYILHTIFSWNKGARLIWNQKKLKVIKNKYDPPTISI